MITITLKDWAGLELSKTDMTESELGFDGDITRLERMAQNVANQRTGSVKIEQDGKLLTQASFLNEVC